LTPLKRARHRTRLHAACSSFVFGSMRDARFGDPAMRFKVIPVIDRRSGPLARMAHHLGDIIRLCRPLACLRDASGP